MPRDDEAPLLRHPREGGDPVIPSLVWIPAFAGMTGRRALNVPNSSVNAILYIELKIHNEDYKDNTLS